jgi:hypothetical protein
LRLLARRDFNGYRLKVKTITDQSARSVDKLALKDHALSSRRSLAERHGLSHSANRQRLADISCNRDDEELTNDRKWLMYDPEAAIV